MRKIYFYLLVVSIYICPIEGAYSQTVHIDLSATNQVIRGFGGIHINSWQGTTFNEDLQQKAFDNTPGRIGLSMFRLRIDPDKNGWASELPIAQYAHNNGAIVFASPWNPPAHMREVLRETEHGTDYVLLEEYYDDYVNHLNDYIDYMEDNGVPLYAVSVQNEPDWHSWTAWTPQQMLKFVRENAQDINARVIAPESLQYRREMSDPLLNDPVANGNFDILGTHLYGTPKSNFYYPLAYEKGKEIWMTEHIYGSDRPEINDWSMALDMAEEINLCMDANMSAYVYWYIRRFYGLIDDEGNITDKGYVMSQFSKFIPSGAVRVGVDNFKVSEFITATAYKTDTSFTMVIVNKGFGNTSLTFDIPGIDFETLTQFTTSSSKKVVNDGEIAIAGGSFSATVDGRSVTTFTTHPASGGKQGNLPPVASAGDNLEWIDEDGIGEVMVTLQGSESYDLDGEIVNYSWSKDGQQIAWVPDLELPLNVGDHTFLLTVTDNDGATHKKTINVSVVSLLNTEVWLEAECTAVGGNWVTHKALGSSNGEFLMVKDGVQATSEPSPIADHLVYHFHVPEGGNYKIWGRTRVPSADDDSFWVRVNDGDWINWNGIRGGNAWQWDYVHGGTGEAILFALESGNHTLTVSYREDGAAIDKFYITNTGKIPADIGEGAENCESITGIAPDVTNANNSITIFPNPAKSIVNVEGNHPFSRLYIYTLSGAQMGEAHLSHETTAAELSIGHLQKGIYLLRIVGEKHSSVVKLVVE